MNKIINNIDEEKDVIELEYNLICDFIKLRNKLGLTQKQMAEEAHTVREMIAVIENGTKHPQINTLIKILKPFGYTLSITKIKKKIIITKGEKMKENKLETISNLFENSTIRSIWDKEKEEYYFSVVDVINALANPKDARKYWSVLKSRLKKEGSEVTTNCSQLKMLAPDGKVRLRDAMKTNDILRLIESIPSPKAEPFKMWLANLGSERIDEVFDPEIAIKRAINYYRNRGYSDKWIESRLKGILDRNKLTEIWKEGGITENYE